MSKCAIFAAAGCWKAFPELLFQVPEVDLDIVLRGTEPLDAQKIAHGNDFDEDLLSFLH